MAKTRSHPARRGARGWFVAVFILLALIVAGFAVGLIAGVVWEEPGLVYAYVTGETEDVAWNSPASEAVKGQDSATRSAVVPEVIADPKIRREQAAGAKAPVPAVSAGPIGEFAIQVGAFASSQAADGLADDLRTKGFDVYVSPGTKAGESRWRVRVGPVATRAEAEGTARRLKQVEKLPTWILKEDAF